MREIKFRAWNKKTKHMLYDIAIFRNTIMFHYQPNEDFELLQFTGLHDRNHKEIWEGDVVKDSQIGENAIIGFSDGSYTFTFKKKKGQIYEDCFQLNKEYCKAWLEVIGNRWENPELLGE